MHAFLEFEFPILLCDLREYVVSLFPDVGLDIQTCHSKRRTENIIKYWFMDHM